MLYGDVGFSVYNDIIFGLWDVQKLIAGLEYNETACGQYYRCDILR